MERTSRNPGLPSSQQSNPEGVALRRRETCRICYGRPRVYTGRSPRVTQTLTELAFTPPWAAIGLCLRHGRARNKIKPLKRRIHVLKSAKLNTPVPTPFPAPLPDARLRVKPVPGSIRRLSLAPFALPTARQGALPLDPREHLAPGPRSGTKSVRTLAPLGPAPQGTYRTNFDLRSCLLNPPELGRHGNPGSGSGARARCWRGTPTGRPRCRRPSTRRGVGGPSPL